MKIYYPKRSKFLKPCEEAIYRNKKSLFAGDPVSVKLSPRGYNDEIRVNIEKTNSSTFWADWDGSDSTRFPVRIKASAYVLFKEGCYGDFIIAHKTGDLTIQYISLSSDDKKRVDYPDLPKKDEIEKRRTEPVLIDKKIDLNGDMSKDPRIAFLLEYGMTIRPHELFSVLHDGATSVIEENPFAFALATVLDRGTRAEVIWTIPYYLQKEIGESNAEFFVGKTIDEIENIFQRLPLKPRYMNDAPRTIKELSEIVVNEFNGDASEIWKNKSSKEVKTTFQRVYGVGPGIASMAVLLLERCFGIQFNDMDHRNMDVKPDIHVIRVFGRLGFIFQLNENEALEAARRLNPEYPGALDAPIWIIGRKWCIADSPKCSYCPVNDVCPKNIIQDKSRHGGID